MSADNEDNASMLECSVASWNPKEQFFSKKGKYSYTFL